MRNGVLDARYYPKNMVIWNHGHQKVKQNGIYTPIKVESVAGEKAFLTKPQLYVHDIYILPSVLNKIEGL